MEVFDRVNSVASLWERRTHTASFGSLSKETEKSEVPPSSVTSTKSWDTSNWAEVARRKKIKPNGTTAMFIYIDWGRSKNESSFVSSFLSTFCSSLLLDMWVVKNLNKKDVKGGKYKIKIFFGGVIQLIVIEKKTWFQPQDFIVYCFVLFSFTCNDSSKLWVYH